MTFDQKVNEWRSRRLPKNRRSNGTLEAEIIRMTARLAELEVALGFYAERNNYHCRVMVQGPGHIDMLDSAIDDDKHGNIARAALSTHTEEPKT